jgi:O-methyltransferase involved in polyketide biosynthesis
MGAEADGPTLVPVDFRVDRIDDHRVAAGHDACVSSLFVCEGLLVYLERVTIVSLLSALRAASSPDSCLAATLAVHAEGLPTSKVCQRANAARRNAVAEPWRTILPAGEHLELLSRSGWLVTEAVDDALPGCGAPPDRSLNVVVVLGHGRDPERWPGRRPGLGSAAQITRHRGYTGA